MEPNQQATFNSQNVPPNMDQPISDENGERRRKIGPKVAIIVVVLLLIIGALYFFAPTYDKSSTSKYAEDMLSGQDGMIDGEGYLMMSEQQTVKPIVNTSDDVQSLEADLNAATKGLDAQNF